MSSEKIKKVFFIFLKKPIDFWGILWQAISMMKNEYETQLREFDWKFKMSDDYRVFRKASDEFRSLEIQAKDSEENARLWAEYTKKNERFL